MKKSSFHRVGIFGGSFDPIHLGHLVIGQEILEKKKLDAILFMPTGISPHKKNEMAPDHKRLEWVKMSIKSNPDFRISDFEIQKEGKSYTYETVLALQENYPDVEFSYIVGEDSILSIETWYRYKDLLSLIPFLVVRRSPKWERALEEKIDLLNKNGYRVEEVDFTFLDISSTQIRNKFKEGKNPQYLLNEEVYKDIKNGNYYRSENL